MMNGRAGQIAMRVLAWLMVALLVTGLVPALPEVPYALAESKEKMVELGGESQPSEDGSEGLGLPIVGDVRDGGAHADGNAEVAPADGAESVVVEGAGQGDCFGNDAQGLKVQEDTDTDMAEVEDAVRDDKLTLAAQTVSVSDPRVAKDSDMESGQVTTWDCVWFGSYPQTEVVPGGEAYASLQSASWDANGDAIVGGRRYRRIAKSDATNSDRWSDDGYGSAAYRYFRYEPIKWRVLKVSGSSALVVADVALDGQRYNAISADVTWETSSIRSWLNGYGDSSNQPGTDFSDRGFIDKAFSAAEKSAILTTNLVNADGVFNGTVGGNDTKDKVFFLSEGEVSGDGGTSHGFMSDYDANDEARRCKVSGYAHAMGAAIYRDIGKAPYSNGECDDNCYWWLRSPGFRSGVAAGVYYYGHVSPGSPFGVYDSGHAVRPALNLDLTSPSLQAAGTVSSNGDVNEQTAPDGGPVTDGSPSFSDVTDKTAHVEDISWLASSGISKGWSMPDGTVQFRPYANVARADMAAFLFRLAKGWGLVKDGWKPAGTASFGDVTAKTSHYDEIMWLAESGISQGWSFKAGKEFRPYANVARADMAAFLHRLAQKAGVGGSAAGGAAFRDVSAKTAHADDIAWLATTGVSKGWDVAGGKKEFRPLANVARADMAAFLHRLDGLR